MTQSTFQRWTARRKAEFLNELDACPPAHIPAFLARHDLTADEVASWRRRYERHGAQGLEQLRIRQLRT